MEETGPGPKPRHLSLPATSCSSFWGIMRRFQAWWDIKSLQKVLDLPWGLLPVGHVCKTFTGRRHAQLTPVEVEEQRLYFDDSVTQPVSKAGSSGLISAPCIQDLIFSAMIHIKTTHDRQHLDRQIHQELLLNLRFNGQLELPLNALQ
ncbi:hypothetical protein ILYODFUR_035690 [Ilyodon furcidens]|uniref:Uncharacterized protein n=1 Tax=Ilyodon furcidens TaxID=33524 RepID=A0ABV0V8V1_9TELE